ncbi:MAG: SIS domain-containing protein [Alphaproteobacteria bacterium]
MMNPEGSDRSAIESYRDALAELADVAERLDERQIEVACAMIAGARRTVLYGCGREGLQMRGFAMRLFHLGLDVAMVADMTTPPVAAGDLFLCSAGPGSLSTVDALMSIARTAGAGVLLVTAQPDSPSSGLATDLLVIPAQTMATDTGGRATSVLPMGSLYEGALFVLFEVMVMRLRALLGVTAEAMRARHTNLE